MLERLKKFLNWKWEFGRQNFYYKKLRLYEFYKTDCYLIRYSSGCEVGYHKDLIEGHKHYRLNIHIKGKNSLAIINENPKKWEHKKSRFCFFRSDYLHSFGPTLEKGLILSFGLAIKKGI